MIALDVFTPDHSDPYTTAYMSEATPEAVEKIRDGWAELLRSPITIMVRDAPEDELAGVFDL